MTLRTDKELMGEKDVNGWVESIIRNTHRVDIQILAARLNEELEKEKMELIFSRIWHMCDACELTYPENITYCQKCNNDKLRSFSIYNNTKELEKNFR
jgi:hypothetical protein